MQTDTWIERHRPGWQAAWRALAPRMPAPALLAQLAARYAEPHRHYHTLQHLDACLRHLDTMRTLAQRPDEVALALWFHDAIYDIGAADNEARSADWARAELLALGAADEVAQRVHALVMVTRHDQPPRTPDQELLLDVDLAILGAPTALFDAYEQQVRLEYQAVPPAAFRSNRRRILQGFVDRPRIYHTAAFHDTREAQARANLQRSIQALGLLGQEPPGCSQGE
ncbi:MAG: N-methyl-D-aspartate receptor NMDAR2C subunit [Rhodoferax sp.]|nr:N-methyl-D-aspartate receptor NMDAR2C subunit [Rhodoferax sp.]